MNHNDIRIWSAEIVTARHVHLVRSIYLLWILILRLKMSDQG